MSVGTPKQFAEEYRKMVDAADLTKIKNIDTFLKYLNAQFEKVFKNEKT